MAARPDRSQLGVRPAPQRRPAAVAACLLCLLAPAWAQTPLTLEQAASRIGRDYVPAYAGEVVLVRGTVASAPVGMLFYDHLSIQDESMHGLVLESLPGRMSSLRPGDVVEARGTLTNRAGLPVVTVAAIQVGRHVSPPVPRPLNPGDLNSFRYLGTVAVTEGRVIGKGENTGGEYLYVGDRLHPLQVFLPHRGNGTIGTGLSGFEVGDKVRASGISSQYCPSPPYRTRFQLLVGDPGDVVLLVKRWPVAPELFFTALLALGSVLAAWWIRERRMAAQRATAMALASLGEDLIGADSAPEILSRIARVLPRALGTSHVGMYLYNRGARTLDPVDTGGEARTPIPVDTPDSALPPPPAACFRNRTLLAIPRTRRTPFYARRKPGVPRSVLLVPMCAQAELLGVLQIGHPHRRFSPDEQVASQHLANQVAISIKLMEQESIRQRLYRSEKLAAAGQLISGVAGDLRAPLERILDLAGVGDDSAPAAVRLKAVRQEARNAAEILDRVVAIARSEPGEEKTVDLNALLRGLAGFRLLQWQVRGITFEDRLGSSPLWIVADAGQLERAFLDLLLDAERALADAPGRQIAISTKVAGGRALVDLTYGSAEPITLSAEASQEWIFRHAVHSCGGELRLAAAGETSFRMEIELPLAGPAASETPRPADWTLTVLLVEPDETSRQDLLRMLTARGCRVIPVPAAEQATGMAERLRFDAIFCSMQLPGLSWVDFLERVRGQAGSFVLLTAALGASAWELGENGAFVLQKPVREAELDSVLSRIDSQQLYPEHISAQ